MGTYRIPEIAKKYVEHDMIQTYTELPAFPDSRAGLLFALLPSDKEPAGRNELYALVVWLVQLGLDTHDLVDDGSEKRKETEMRATQLKVLAGTYFSSRFYQLLSQAGQIDMIRKISAAICDINRLKMSLYERMKQFRMTADEYIGACTELKTGLFELFGGLLEERASAVWPELLRGFSRCEVVLGELERTESPSRFEGSWGYWRVMEQGTEDERRALAQQPREEGVVRQLVAKYDIRAQLTERLRQSIAHIQAAAGRLDSDKLAAELAAIGQKLHPSFAMQPAVYNETR